tara:strand:- start:234 stop:641 length:408 start_codon:yes stop_codon:yes gene_type:complete
MPISQISNGESGSSVRTKLNAVITATNAAPFITPYNAGDLTATPTLDLANGSNQYGTMAGNLTLQVPAGTPVEKVSAIQLYITGDGNTLDFDAAIIRPSDSAAIFPKTLTSTKVYLLQLRYYKSQWNLVSLVGGY